ncbi:hypothetical protein CRE_16169 [Caenorhabditis remanei]|uniref:Uncharacterized protein n=1 Tax=Caenorhabditis remanei TaxID=31234 RepID=E3MSN3_CAERE|nr:hypothetical protein CRE_16169 [Caenorhabditis remanei]
MSSLEEVREIKDRIVDLQKQINTNLHSSKHTTLHAVPSKDRADTNNETIEDYLGKYMVTLRSEEAKFKDQYKTYKEELYKGLSELYQAPIGTTFAEQAIKYAEEIEKGDTTVREGISEIEKRLQNRHETANEVADEENVQKYGEYRYKIREYEPAPQWRKEQQPIQVNHQKTKKHMLSSRDMEIPIFYGDIAEWPAFFMMFDPMVAKNEDFSDVMKHNILRQHLKGAAYDIVRPFKTDGTEY